MGIGPAPGTEALPRILVEPGRMGRRYWRWLAVALLLAACLQLGQVQRRADLIAYDGPKYVNDAHLLADGEGFVGADAWFFSRVRRESAIHPPANALWMSLASVADWRSTVAAQRWQVPLGVAAVLATALAARQVAGDRASLIAGGLAAVHPAVWSYPALVMAETPAQAYTAAALAAMLRWWRAPSVLWAAVIGGSCALAALARSENLVLLPLLAAPMVVHPAVRGRWLPHLGAAALWATVLVAPWIGFNLMRFQEPVLIASGVDVAMAGASCSNAFEGDYLGYWSPFCRPFNEVQLHPDGTPMDESEEGVLMREATVSGIRDNSDRMPVVVLARIARTLSIWSPVALAEFEETEHREAPVLLLSNLLFLGMLVPAVAGARQLRRAGWTLAPAIAPLVAAVLGAAVTHGTTRYRAGFDLAVVVLAAVALDAWLRSRASGQRAQEAQA